MAWPSINDLKIGNAVGVQLADGEHRVELLGTETVWRPDYWIENLESHQAPERRLAYLTVDGTEGVADLRPFSLPSIIGNVQVSLEATTVDADWPTYHKLGDLKGDARLGFLPANETWGTPNLHFPIVDYRWRAGNYQNTWGAVVPYNCAYLHRGEDWGFPADCLKLQTVCNGTVLRSPLPGGDERSNSVCLGSENAIWTYAHMNTESLDPAMLCEGKVLDGGTAFGYTGETWMGKKQQKADPHLHLDLQLNGQSCNPYPAMVNAYMKQSGDPLLAIAGGYAYSLPGKMIYLDGGRSLAGPGNKIVRWEWHLSDGTCSNTMKTRVGYASPGLYSEELRVWDYQGNEDRDFLQVRVWDPDNPKATTPLWLAHMPCRDISVNDKIRFCIGAYKPPKDLMFDPGDGSEPIPAGLDGIEYSYDAPEIYGASLNGTDNSGHPLSSRIRVCVNS